MNDRQHSELLERPRAPAQDSTVNFRSIMSAKGIRALSAVLLMTLVGAVACTAEATDEATDEGTVLVPRPDAIELVFYDPAGLQTNPELAPLPPTSAAVGVMASDLQNVTHGLASGTNTDRRPVLFGAGPLDVDDSFYIAFTLTPDTAELGVFLTTISYTYRSYADGATGTISLRTSADDFATTVDSQSWTGGSVNSPSGIVPLTFDATTIPLVAGPLEIRLYMHDLVGGLHGIDGFPDGVDWADLESTSGDPGGDGLRVNGNVHTP